MIERRCEHFCPIKDKPPQQAAYDWKCDKGLPTLIFCGTGISNASGIGCAGYEPEVSEKVDKDGRPL